MFQSGSEGRAAQQCAVLTRLLSPLLANIALSVLDEHFCAKWDAHRTSQRRDAHRKRGGATYRIVRYADDFVIMVAGTKAHADALWDEVAQVIARWGCACPPRSPGYAI
jgi:RNA-directed DNA polymerase